MAAVGAVLRAHATLSTTTIDTVTLTGSPLKVDVINRGAQGDAPLYVTWAFDGSTPDDPVADADETEVVMAGGYVTIADANGARPASFVVKVLGNGNSYSVCGRVGDGGRGSAGTPDAAA